MLGLQSRGHAQFVHGFGSPATGREGHEENKRAQESRLDADVVGKLCPDEEKPLDTSAFDFDFPATVLDAPVKAER